jgi:poly(beta-D-mannuronate) lyase
VYGNFFIGNRKSNTGGVRVIGENHTIYNNYFCGLYGSSFRSALPVLNGVPNSPLNRYFQVKNAQIVFNTFIDCKYTMIIGAGADDERTLRPQDCIIANNLVKTNYQAIEQKAEPINITWEGNIMQGSSLGIARPEGITIINPQLVLAEDGLWRPAEFSPAIGTATGDYDFVIDDMDGQPRDDGEKDIGCDEFSDVPVVNRPLTQSDVGPDWINNLDLPVTLLVTTNGSGIVMINPAGGIYDVGTVVTLTALPQRNCTFNGWSGDLTGTANPDSIIMDSNKRVTATFAALP